MMIPSHYSGVITALLAFLIIDDTNEIRLLLLGVILVNIYFIISFPVVLHREMHEAD
jgi:hypothetical protein